MRLTKRLNFSGFVARDLARLKGTTSPGRCDWKESVVCQSAYAAAVTRLQTTFRKATHTTPRMHYFVFERMRVDPLAQLNAVLKIAGLPIITNCTTGTDGLQTTNGLWPRGAGAKRHAPHDS